MAPVVKHKPRSKKDSAGGSATAGGINFQAAVAACVATHVATGEKLHWLSGIADDIPTSIASETGGGGDDIAITLRDGTLIETQVKKGLTASKRLWDSLERLARGLDEDEYDFGILVVCPRASATIRKTLAEDIPRFADGRADDVGDLARKLQGNLRSMGIALSDIAGRLRVVVMHCVQGDESSIVTAHSQLQRICAKKEQTQAAWDRLYADATNQIAIKGRRTAASIAGVLASAGILLRSDERTPTAIAAHIAQSTVKGNTTFSIKGVAKPLSLDDAWIQITARVREGVDAPPTDLATAVQKYHGWNEKTGTSEREVAAHTIGWFVRHCVVVGGPGMGKTTLSAMLSRRYAQMGHPVLRVRLRSLAARMRMTGAGVEEGLVALGLDGSGVAPTDLETAGLDGWTIVCDGLDEACDEQESICEGLRNIVSARPSCRVIVTTRPVGYQSNLLADWRHYELRPLNESGVQGYAQALIEEIQESDSEASNETRNFFAAELKANKSARVGARSPLLLTLMVSLALQKVSFGSSRVELYERLFRTYEDSTSEREKRFQDLSLALAKHFLDVLAWTLLNSPSDPLQETIEQCAEIVATDLECTPLRSLELCEQCLEFWEHHGIVERLHVPGAATVTFVLQTFGEFAAARFLVKLPSEDRKAWIARCLAEPEWSEVFEFSANLGSASDLVEVAMAREMSSSREAAALMRALTAIATGTPEVDQELRARSISVAIDAITSPNRSEVAAIGNTLLSVARRYSKEVAPKTYGLTQHKYPWTRLVAWAIAVSDKSSFEQSAFVNAFGTISDWYQRPAIRGLAGGINLRTDGEFDLIQEFLVGSARIVLSSLPKKEGDELLSRVFQDKGSWSLSVYEVVNSLLREAGRNTLSSGFGLGIKDLLWSPQEFQEKHYRVDVEILECLCSAIGGEETELSHPAPLQLIHLSAFLEASGYGRVAASDIWHWPDQPNREVVTEVLRGILHCSSIPRGPLLVEARRALQLIDESETKGGIDGIWDKILYVDVDVDLRLAGSAFLSATKLEQALLLGPAYTTNLAAALLMHTLNSSEILDVLKRLLPVAGRNGLWVASIMSTGGEGKDVIRLILSRLEESLTPGCEHLFQKIEDDDSEPLDIRAAVRNGLFCENADIAVSAAKKLAQRASTLGDDLVPLIRDAYKHWQETEEPYPTKGGVIPASPRADLLRILLIECSPTIEELIEYSSDPRSDVREEVAPLLREAIAGDDKVRSMFLDAVAAERIPSGALTKALRSSTPFSVEQISQIKNLLKHRSPRVRFAAMGLLNTEYLSDGEIQDISKVLQDDSEGEIRDRALEIGGNYADS